MADKDEQSETKIKCEKGTDSIHSHSSRRSLGSRSSASTSTHTNIHDLLAMKTSKAAAAKVRLKYIEREEKLKRELALLRCEKELQEAEAEVLVIKEFIDESSEQSETFVSVDLPQIDKRQLVTDYIRDIRKAEPQISNEFKPNLQQNFNPVIDPNHMMKRDLMLASLSTFDDTPETYISWKTKFQRLVQEIGANVSEELDLLTKWLGPNSSRQATRLRMANSHNEQVAKEKVWQRLEERFGAPEYITESLRVRLENFPKLRIEDKDKFFELADLVCEIKSVRKNEKYKAALAYFDSSHGLNTIVCKLPPSMQNKWIDSASNYKAQFGVIYPPFSFLSDFVEKMASRVNDPSFRLVSTKNETSLNTRTNSHTPISGSTKAFTKKTNIQSQDLDPEFMCPFHGDSSKHTLMDCRSFENLTLEDKREFVKKMGLCFKCLKGNHIAKDCDEHITCSICDSLRHCTPFHINKPYSLGQHGGESRDQLGIDNKCTKICGKGPFQGKSCAKTLLVKVYPKGNPDNALKTYAIIDDQSNKSLARSALLDHFQVRSESIEYTLLSCSGRASKTGRQAQGFVIEALDGSCQLECPPLLECNEIPDNKQEVATPAIANEFSHLRDLEHSIPEIDDSSRVLLLIGRDLLKAHHVLDQRIGRENEPYAQRLRLGWVIIGEACLGMVHKSNHVDVRKTNILFNGRESIFKPCQNIFEVNDSIFHKSADDDLVGLSREDRQFFKQIKSEMTRSPTGKLSCPLPLRDCRQTLPNNFVQAKKRSDNLILGLKRDQVKQQHFLEFMERMFVNNQVEIAPPVQEGQEIWYLPIFGVYHPKKPSKIRVVFDSSAKYKDVCLNDVLLKGPDLTNNLMGVLTKFRKERFAAMADVEQMFFNFEVEERHRNLLRFLWFKDNNPDNPIIEYRMKVHVFGNSPSPAIATYGIRKAVCSHENDNFTTCDEVCHFVNDNFYVDDALVSRQKERDLVDLIRHAQDRLSDGGKIRLHKIVSNNTLVLDSFPPDDLAQNVSEIDFCADTPFIQKSLGLSWDVVNDCFTYQVQIEEKPYTKRGLLSVINGLFDPLGFVAPVVLDGRLILRQAIQNNDLDWDDPLPNDLLSDWKTWMHSLPQLIKMKVPRPFVELPFDSSPNRELHVFSDASKEAVAAVVYLKVYDVNRKSQIGFVLGKSKLAPRHGHTIPRLELCAAVLATELAAFVQRHLDISPTSVFYYTDSQVVLGYINNTSRRFYVYVANRVDKILRLSSPSQWQYVPTNANPADQGTRSLKADEINDSLWLIGPQSFLHEQENNPTCYDLIDPDLDKEIYPEVMTNKVQISQSGLGASRFERFSSWSHLVRAIGLLKRKASSFHDNCEEKVNLSDCEIRKLAEIVILKEIQKEIYAVEIDCIRKGRLIPKNSKLRTLSPVLDTHGLLRVGGRLSKSSLGTGEKNPIIVPGDSHVATLLVRHYHNLVRHQGRHFTEGSVRSAGYWLTRGKRLISQILRKCVLCRRLRAPLLSQEMSDLPSYRVNPSPPFTYVGVDTFGPWSIVTRKTRGGQANSKRWAIMFSCLSSRAVHIEVVEDMSASCFINALRRFVSLRGPVKEFHSDRGTNFVGAVSELDINKVNVEDDKVKRFFDEQGSTWFFNAPHASHMGGSWERMIGLARKILDSMLISTNPQGLTDEVLRTFMAEVTCIINSRPITPVSTDPSSPFVLSPNTLLTQKINSEVEPFQHLDLKDMYKSQWRYVQVLANQFWKAWRNQYLQNLQTRKKWCDRLPNLKEGDVVVMIDNSVPRIQWPLGVIDRVFPGSDNLVRKVSVRVINDDKTVFYTRPITQLIHLL